MDSIDDPRVRAAVDWILSVKSPTEPAQLAIGMLAAADAVDPLRQLPPVPPSIIERYIPDAIEIDETDIVEFTTLQELLAIPFVAQFHRDVDFYRFSRLSWGSLWALMAEFDQGRRWHLVGLMTGPPPDLPLFQPVR
jgi:hypothetical protein